MQRTWFALASLAGVAAAAACSEKAVSVATIASDAGTEPEASVASSTSSSGSAATACLDPTPIDATKIPYKAAGPAVTGACTNAELTAISTYYQQSVGGATPLDTAQWRAQVSPTCAGCAFTDDSGNSATTWNPIILANDAFDLVDLGGCVEHLGGSFACAQAYQQVQVCEVNACASKCTTQTQFNACRQDATVLTTACKDAFAAVKADCGSVLSTYETECNSTNFAFEGPIRIACIAPPAAPSDAGADAGDAGDGGT